MRDYEIQTRLMEFILPIYEQAKIEEQKEIPVVLVLDKGMPAERKSAPKRAIIVLAAFLISLLLGISYVLILESFQNLKSEEARYQTFRNGIILPLKHFFKSNVPLLSMNRSMALRFPYPITGSVTNRPVYRPFFSSNSLASV